VDEITQQGIAALKAGDKARARFFLRSALESDLDNLQAWMWLSGAVELDDERLTCLQQVMRIDPGNPAAARGIALLTGKDITDVLAEAAAAAVATVTSSAGAPETGLVAGPTDIPQGEAGREGEDHAPVIATTVVEEEVKEIGSLSAATGAIQEDIPVDPGPPIFKTRPSLLPVLIVLALAPMFLFAILIINFILAFELTYLPPIILALIVIVLGLCIAWLAMQLSIRYTLFAGSVEIARGIFRRSRRAILKTEIKKVTCRRSILQRLAGIGSIIIEVEGEDPRQSFKFTNLPRCEQWARQIRQQFGLEGS
jgi:ribosomal protein L12E/L44/L45/RPP1/RPP2/membrane protein YdbS with pleckstrin-like domain